MEHLDVEAVRQELVESGPRSVPPDRAPEPELGLQPGLDRDLAHAPAERDPEVEAALGVLAELVAVLARAQPLEEVEAIGGGGPGGRQEGGDEDGWQEATDHVRTISNRGASRD
jgi:hypothetical protein